MIRIQLSIRLQAAVVSAELIGEKMPLLLFGQNGCNVQLTSNGSLSWVVFHKTANTKPPVVTYTLNAEQIASALAEAVYQSKFDQAAVG